jgi:hypothetical protein
MRVEARRPLPLGETCSYPCCRSSPPFIECLRRRSRLLLEGCAGRVHTDPPKVSKLAKSRSRRDRRSLGRNRHPGRIRHRVGAASCRIAQCNAVPHHSYRGKRRLLAQALADNDRLGMRAPGGDRSLDRRARNRRPPHRSRQPTKRLDSRSSCKQAQVCTEDLARSRPLPAGAGQRIGHLGKRRQARRLVRQPAPPRPARPDSSPRDQRPQSRTRHTPMLRLGPVGRSRPSSLWSDSNDRGSRGPADTIHQSTRRARSARTQPTLLSGSEAEVGIPNCSSSPCQYLRDR